MASKKRSAFNDECPICFEKTGNERRITFSCGHSYHRKCFQQVSKTECPCCRKDVSSELPKSWVKRINQNRNRRNEEIVRGTDNEHALLISEDILRRIGFIGHQYVSTYFTDDSTENISLASRIERICNFHFQESRKGLINETKIQVS